MCAVVLFQRLSFGWQMAINRDAGIHFNEMMSYFQVPFGRRTCWKTTYWNPLLAAIRHALDEALCMRLPLVDYIKSGEETAATDMFARLSVGEIQAHIGQRLCDAAHARRALASWRIGATGLVS